MKITLQEGLGFFDSILRHVDIHNVYKQLLHMGISRL
jgi:hypothetical protein